MHRRRVRPFALLSAFCLAAAAARAEQLPLKVYTTAEGLPSDRIECILADSHGFLWFGTGDGLARFDGYGFRNLGTPEGLPPGPVSALIESRDGTYWVGTAAGLVRFDASHQPARSGVSLRVLRLPGDERSNDVEALAEDRNGVLWLGTLGGLFRVLKTGDPKIERVPLDAPGLTDATTIFALVEDGGGNLWLGAETGLYRRSPGGHIERFADHGGLPADVRCMVRDRSGALWVGSHREGLFEVPTGEKETPAPRHAYTRARGLAGDFVTHLLATADGRVWATCFGGLSEIAPDRASIRTYTATEGLTGLGLWSLGEDRNGNLWIGSDDAGVMRLAHGGFRRFDARDGLTSLRVGALFENRDGLPCALTRGQRPEDIAGADGFLECFDGRRFQTQRPRLPPGTSFGWGWAQLPLRDPEGRVVGADVRRPVPLPGGSFRPAGPDAGAAPLLAPRRTLVGRGLPPLRRRRWRPVDRPRRPDARAVGPRVGSIPFLLVRRRNPSSAIRWRSHRTRTARSGSVFSGAVSRGTGMAGWRSSAKRTGCRPVRSVLSTSIAEAASGSRRAARASRASTAPATPSPGSRRSARRRASRAATRGRSPRTARAASTPARRGASIASILRAATCSTTRPTTGSRAA